MNAAGQHSPARSRDDETALYRELQPRLLGLLRGRVRGLEQTLEDACSFAWVQFVRREPDRGESLLGWLYVVACREAWRLVERESRVPTLAPETVAQLSGGDERHAELRAAAVEALHVLAALPERQRRLLAGKAAGYNYRELAALEHSSVGAVSRHLTRAHRGIEANRGANF